MSRSDFDAMLAALRDLSVAELFELFIELDREFSQRGTSASAPAPASAPPSTPQA